MSQLNVDTIKNRLGTAGPTVLSLTVTNNVTVGGALTVTGSINTSGIITATSIVVSAGTTALPSISPTGDSNTGIFFPAADTVAISEGGAEALRVDSSGRLLIGISTSGNANGGVLQLSSGITFPATQVAATDVNTLDDYEEGTWTPTITDSIGAAVMVSGATGFYTKIGNLVTLSFNEIQWSSKGTLATAPINITGFPFTSRNLNRQVGQVAYATAGSFANANRLILSMEAGRTQAGFYSVNATTNQGTPYDMTNLGTSGILYGMSLSFNV